MDEMNSVEKVDSKSAIMKAALAEFAEYGLDGARVDRIAKLAGVNKAMIYYYFSSKNELHREIVNFVFKPFLDRMRTSVHGSDNIVEGLRSFASEFAQFAGEVPEFRRILLHELAAGESEMVHTLAVAIVASGLPDHLKSAMERRIAAGEFRHIAVIQALVSFQMMNIGYLLLAPVVDRIWSVQDRRAFLEERKESILDLFLYGVVKR
jgi:AcrR family transcriptional regulator